MSNTTTKLSMKSLIINASLDALTKHGPKHYRALYELIKDQVQVGGNDPAYTTYAHVFYDIKDATEEAPSKFIMCGKGVFGLAGRDENADISKAVPSRSKTEKVWTVEEIDAEILRLTQLKEHITQQQAQLKAERGGK